MRTPTERPSDLTALAMENDLLRHEVRYLRAQVSDLEEEVAARLLVPEGHRLVDEDDLRTFEKANSDMRWLMGRLAGSPAGWLLRRWGGFRTLQERYGSS